MNKLLFFDNPESLCRAAAGFIAELSATCIASKGNFSIALSGGNTPRKLFELLATNKYASVLEWKKIFIFWGDERCVAFEDERNNSHIAMITLLDKVPIPKENIFRVNVDVDASLAANSYEQTIKEFFHSEAPAFDLILLGLGDNGHTASLFPYTSILKETKSLVKEVFVKEQEMYRVSFTAPLINQAKNILFLITGKEKAEVLTHIFSKDIDTEKYPAQLIAPLNEKLFWYIDEAAASEIKNKV